MDNRVYINVIEGAWPTWSPRILQVSFSSWKRGFFAFVLFGHSEMNMVISDLSSVYPQLEISKVLRKTVLQIHS